MPGPSTTTTGERNTGNDPIPREEHLTEEDRAIMTAVENYCVVWRSLKSLKLTQRKRLLAACVDWGKRWGTKRLKPRSSSRISGTTSYTT